MDDLDDILELILDIEDIGEEILEPEELIEDLIEEPIKIALALTALIGGLLTILLILLTLVVLLFTAGPIAVLGTLAAITLIATIFAISGFLYTRTKVPEHIEKRINKALENANETPKKGESLTEEEAINQIKERYSNGEMTDEELEKALDEVLKHEEKPENIVKQHN